MAARGWGKVVVTLIILYRYIHTFSRDEFFLPPNPVMPTTKKEN